MWQVSIYFHGAWWGIGPNYATKAESEQYISDWFLAYGATTVSSRIPFRVDQVRDTDVFMTSEDILAREG